MGNEDQKRAGKDTIEVRHEYYPPSFLWGVAHELTHIEARQRFGDKYFEIARKNFTFQSREALTDLGATGRVFRNLDKRTLYEVLKYRSTMTPKLIEDKRIAYLIGDLKGLDIIKENKDPLDIYRKVLKIPLLYPEAKIILKRGGFKVIDSSGKDISKKAFSRAGIAGKTLRILMREEY